MQVNLLASGAGDSEIYIWDLGNPDKPMTPGSKSQVQHTHNKIADHFDFPLNAKINFSDIVEG